MSFSRQQILLGLLIVTAAAVVGDQVVQSVIQGPLLEKQATQRQLQEEIRKQQEALAAGRSAGREIVQLQKRSLPSGTEVARSAYRSWLLDVVQESGLRSATVDSGSPANRGGLFQAMRFGVRARGSLPQITEFLFLHSRSDQLHRVTAITLNPVGSSGQFDASISIEGLMLPKTDRKTLNNQPSTFLASAELHEYDSIARNNVFGVGIGPDPMAKTILSAITSSGGVSQAWITDLIDDEVTRVNSGDEFDTTALSGRVLEIDRDTESVIIESGGQQLVMSIGQSFAEADLHPTP